MRGKVNFFKFFRCLAGITPAYAGKSSVFLKFRPPTRDHPRLCGEKTIHFCTTPPMLGSPPPMRGKVDAPVQRAFFEGITPAYAGKSTCRRLPQDTFRDHPRLCGEKTKKIPKQRYFFHQPTSFSFSLQYT